ncbi:MAG TPA: class I SAM-dependent methyltransferase [Acidimicrobiales bacterium]|nr:class I SAM-dependent methyltransferase [Acidimicrobiales bacterium]
MSTDDRRRSALLAAAQATKGFLPRDEALALVAAGRRAAASGLGPLLEIGSYLGRSTLFLAAGIVGSDALLYSLDHHHGSEEMQAGWPDHDPSHLDPASGRLDTLGAWRRAVVAAGAEDLVVGLVGDSARVAAHWATPLSLVFIDGGHALAACRADLAGFGPHLAGGGLLVFHDVFPEGVGGGEAPWRCYLEALASGEYAAEEESSCGSLRVLRRIGAKSAAVAPPASASAARSAAAAE